jgi:hypothetical protein
VVISNDDGLAIEDKLANEQIFLFVNGLHLTEDLDLFAGDQRLLNIGCEIWTNARVQHALRGTQHDVNPGRDP